MLDVLEQQLSRITRVYSSSLWVEPPRRWTGGAAVIVEGVVVRAGGGAAGAVGMASDAR